MWVIQHNAMDVTERVNHRSSGVVLLLLAMQMCLSFMFMQLFFLLEALPTGLTLELLPNREGNFIEDMCVVAGI